MTLFHPVVLALALPVSAPSTAAAAETAPARPAVQIEHPWSLEVELVQPFVPTVHIFTVRASRAVWGSDDGLRGDLVLGAFLRPNVEHDVVEEIDEYLGTVGYRQFLWRGLHLEVQLDAGYVWGTNNLVDGKDYANFTLLGEVHAGYRFVFGPGDDWGLVVNPQFGVIHGLVTDIGPRDGKPDTFFSGKLNVGVAF
jgi:hypothetical protein